jgi:hypothetical protein
MLHVLTPDGTMYSKTWDRIPDLKLSINQGRLRYADRKSLVFQEAPNGDLNQIGVLQDFVPEKVTCPHCQKEF